MDEKFDELISAINDVNDTISRSSIDREDLEGLLVIIMKDLGRIADSLVKIAENK